MILACSFVVLAGAVGVTLVLGSIGGLLVIGASERRR